MFAKNTMLCAAAVHSQAAAWPSLSRFLLQGQIMQETPSGSEVLLHKTQDLDKAKSGLVLCMVSIRYAISPL